MNILKNVDFFEGVRELTDECVDLVFADPPYFLSGGGGYTCRGGRFADVKKGDWDISDDPAGFTKKWLSECHRVMKPGASIWVCGTSHNIHDVWFGLHEAGFEFVNEIIWVKPNPPPNLSRRHFVFAHETLLWFYKPGAKYIFNHDAMKAWTPRSRLWSNPGVQMRDVWLLAPPARRVHPTQKPLELVRRAIAASSNPGDLVLDPFAGSGTTCVAAVELGRRFAAFESDAGYFAAARRRLLSVQTRLMGL